MGKDNSGRGDNTRSDVGRGDRGRGDSVNDRDDSWRDSGRAKEAMVVMTTRKWNVFNFIRSY